MGIFETASRMKLRFNYRGQCSTEDLWEIPVDRLDELYGILMSRKKITAEESLLKKKTKEGEVQDLMISLVKHVVEVKLEEQEIRQSRAENKIRRNKIASILEDKRDETLKGMSEEDLEKEMKELA